MKVSLVKLDMKVSAGVREIPYEKQPEISHKDFPKFYFLE
jgi:hypothetical protein